MKNPHAKALGKLGGSANTPAQNEARKRNGAMPCRPGKRRGRPKGSKSKRRHQPNEGRER